MMVGVENGMKFDTVLFDRIHFKLCGYKANVSKSSLFYLSKHETALRRNPKLYNQKLGINDQLHSSHFAEEKGENLTHSDL